MDRASVDRARPTAATTAASSDRNCAIDDRQRPTMRDDASISVNDRRTRRADDAAVARLGHPHDPGWSRHRCSSRSRSRTDMAAGARRQMHRSMRRHGAAAPRPPVARPLDSRRCPPSERPAARATCCRPRRATWTRLERLAADLAARYGYRRIETPLFELTEVFERGVGEVTDIVEKELFRLAPRTEEGGVVGAPAGADGRHRPRLRPARDADLAAAGEADRDRPDVPLRPAAGRPLPPVLAVRRRGDRRRRPGHRRRDHRARGALLPRGRARRRRGPPQLDRRPRLPAGLRRRADGLLPRPRRGPAAELERGRLERNVLRLLDSKDPAMAALNAAAPRITDRLCDACAEHFAGVRAHLDALGVRVPARTRARPRPRLLHPDRVRVLRHRARGPAAGDRRRRPLRRPGRAARRPADARHRLRDRARPAASSRWPRPGPRVAGRAGAGRGRRRRRSGRHRRPGSRSPRSCARRASRPGPSSAGASSASSSRRPPATGPTSRSSSATSWRPARSACATCRPAPRSWSPLADLAREIERAHRAHRHGPAPD